MYNCYIEEERCDHEGYVMSNEFGTFKIVNREGFSVANFKLSKMRVILKPLKKCLSERMVKQFKINSVEGTR